MAKLAKKKLDSLREGEIFINEKGEMLSINDVEYSNHVMMNKGFVKFFFDFIKGDIFNKNSELGFNDLGFLFGWISYGLTDTNVLSSIYLLDCKKNMHENTIYSYLNQLKKMNYIKKVSGLVYMINPSITLYGNLITKDRINMFK